MALACRYNARVCCVHLTQNQYQQQEQRNKKDRENTTTRELIILKIFWGNKCVGNGTTEEEMEGPTSS